MYTINVTLTTKEQGGWTRSVIDGKKLLFKETQLFKETLESETTFNIQATSSSHKEKTPLSVSVDVLLAITSAKIFMKRFNVLASALSPEDQTRRPPQAVCDYNEKIFCIYSRL